MFAVWRRSNFSSTVNRAIDLRGGNDLPKTIRVIIQGRVGVTGDAKFFLERRY